MLTFIHSHRRLSRFLLQAGAFALLALVLQACGSNNGNSAASPSASAVAPSPSASEPASAAPATTNAPEELNFGFVGSTPYTAGAESWGIYKGIFQEELAPYGVKKVNIIPFKVGPDLNEAVLSGRVDIGFSGDAPPILNRAAGAKTHLIGLPIVSSNSLIIVKDDGPQTVAELAGKTVAVVKGSIMHRYLVGVLKEQNVQGVKQISIGSNTADSLAALAKGDVDAVAATDALVYKLLKGGGYKVIDNAYDHPDLLATNATIVTDSYLEKFPEIAQAWNAAREKSLEDLKAHQDEYYQFLSDNLGQDIEAIKVLYPIDDISPTNFTDEGIARITGTKTFLVEEKLAAQDFDINEWILK
ncbi:ABC transporter substrate-binding protein [Cohnella fermenti]|uniref:Transporter substrate-binding domain-containing protein n=1 Tax=Cohnella fermenti TaxID=2565925 RepID=A0A4S4BS19_9BACL|nr:ABC transporter substrate-binding protein [Cohnella fermenti]THF77266.1 transporter substrate-binding domain-containing protein [Cohnella fermenti]